MRSAKETARWFMETRTQTPRSLHDEIAALLKRDRRAMARLAIDVGHRERPAEGRISTAKAIQDAILALDSPPKGRPR